MRTIWIFLGQHIQKPVTEFMKYGNIIRLGMKGAKVGPVWGD
jgi:hypothetical protein